MLCTLGSKRKKTHPKRLFSSPYSKRNIAPTATLDMGDSILFVRILWPQKRFAWLCLRRGVRKTALPIHSWWWSLLPSVPHAPGFSSSCTSFPPIILICNWNMILFCSFLVSKRYEIVFGGFSRVSLATGGLPIFQGPPTEKVSTIKTIRHTSREIFPWSFVYTVHVGT